MVGFSLAALGWMNFIVVDMLYKFQFSSAAQLCPTLCHPMDCSTPRLPVHQQLLELAQTHIHQIGDAIEHLIFCCPFLLLPSVFPSIRVFSNEPTPPIIWPKYLSFRFSISPSNEYSELISFRINWFDLLAVQGTLKSLLQNHSSKASILWHSAFFIVQLSHLYMTNGQTITLTRQTFVGKVMSLLFTSLLVGNQKLCVYMCIYIYIFVLPSELLSWSSSAENKETSCFFFFW